MNIESLQRLRDKLEARADHGWIFSNSEKDQAVCETLDAIVETLDTFIEEEKVNIS